ncbi:alpha/beta hydrolase [Nocardia sp. alder85J]|uniref:alpha/beta hydrolase n=1 Tax=Nocardia sp. alder85J TaxID=2862949 RepID=UPI001CD24DC2|nr:alpha/beta fold hydrolase [Nocardia sp. alder85J]MCX4090762.1 alpha/beta fold hydrolase [Nocardia sp. alder85J]
MLGNSEPAPVLVDVDGIPISGLFAPAPEPRAVVLALHGGATTSAYFDCLGHPELSLLRLGPAAGFTVIALDRPGYGASRPYGDEVADGQRRVDLMYAAVDRILGDLPRGAGLFVLAHSAGSELAVRMAADPERGPRLLGVELSGTGRERQPLAEEILTVRPRPDNARVGKLLWQPGRLYPPEHVGGGLIGAAGPRYEGTLLNEWPEQHFPALAARIRVPVRFTAADHEQVWRNDPEGLREVAALFSAAPRLIFETQDDAGHNISIGYTATAYHLKVLAFAEECAVARRAGAYSDPAEQFDGAAAPEQRR